MMIPLVGISQQRYIIDSDTLVSYTLEENRSIALVFLEGDEYKEFYINAKNVMDEMFKERVIAESYQQELKQRLDNLQ